MTRIQFRSYKLLKVHYGFDGFEITNESFRGTQVKKKIEKFQFFSIKLFKQLLKTHCKTCLIDLIVKQYLSEIKSARDTVSQISLNDFAEQ